MLRRSRKMEHMLNGTTGNAASFPGVNSAKWHWRDNEGCYDFCVEKDDGRQINWIIHSIPRKNLYSLECPNGDFVDRIKSQDVKRELNDELKRLFGEKTSRRSRASTQKTAKGKWEELKTILGSATATQELVSYLHDYEARNIFERVACRTGIQSVDVDQHQPDDLLSVISRFMPVHVCADKVAQELPAEELHNAADSIAGKWDIQLTHAERKAFRDLLPDKVIQKFQAELEPSGFRPLRTKSIRSGLKGVFEAPTGEEIEIDAIKGRGTFVDIHTASGKESFELDRPGDIEDIARQLITQYR